MSDEEKVGGIRGINDVAINNLVISARSTVSQVNEILDHLIVSGIEAKCTLPGLHPYFELFFGNTLDIRFRVASPVPAVADPPSAVPPA